MLKKSFSMGCMIVILSLIIPNLFSQVPQLINYQAFLTNPAGNPINGPRSIEFRIYDTETGGTASWFETQLDTIKDGYLNTLLGSVNPIPYSLFDGSDLYLTLKIGSDPEMKPRKRLVSVGYAFRANHADSLGGKTASDFILSGTTNIVSSVDGVVNNGGNIDLVEGSNITITPDDGANTITISASGGTTGDDLGNHSATQNIKLNGNWISNDGGNEGISMNNDGEVGIGGSPLSPYALNVGGSISTLSPIYGSYLIARTGTIKTGTPSISAGAGDIVSTSSLKADDDVIANGFIATGTPSSIPTYGTGDIVSTNDIFADGNILTGSPTSSYAGQDIASTDDLHCDDDCFVGDDLTVEDHITSTTGHIRTGTPSSSYSNSDIASTSNVFADNNVIAGGYITAGAPGHDKQAGDIIANDDLVAEDNLMIYHDAVINRTYTSSDYELYVNGDTYTSGSYSSSDVKFKKNIENLENGLDKILKLRGTNYDWKLHEFPDRGFKEGKQYGLIAQEVEKVIPEIVREDEEGEKAINYIQIIPLLIEAIKEQQQMIEDLQSRIK